MFSQFYGYTSITYGQSSNPLYNYLQQSDHPLETYLELNYEFDTDAAVFKMHYIGGSMLFNQFVLRNYYEHRFVMESDFRIGADRPIATDLNPSSTEEQNDDSTYTEVEKTKEDSTDIFLHVDLQTSARHDKNEYREFDNMGFTLNTSLRMQAGENSVLRLSNKSEYRQYPNLLPYSNFTDVLTLQLDNGFIDKINYGAFISVGLKNFAKVTYDTSLFEQQQTYTYQTILDSTLVGNGNQRHWQYFTTLDSTESEKILLKKPATNSTFQLTLGTFAQIHWESSSLRAEVNYRVNSQSTLLTLVQNISPTTLNEDLYNDVFHAHGPEVRFIATQTLPKKILFTALTEAELKTFETPAYDFATGAIVKDHRKDSSINIELTLSKFFEINDGFGFDIAVGAAFLRNQSNDNYNDYSITAFSFSVGCGF
ncbi:MAG: hypothetical protein PHP42_05020 [Bacteroidota bacterium]|nr:hypothetical protein [Bacteroidota bacterium]